MRVRERYRIDHVCPGCGAQAVIVAGLVVVPHGQDCPVRIRVAARRARAAAAAGQALAWGAFTLVVVACVAQLGVL